MKIEEIYLDNVLEEIGEFGKYQMRISALVMMVLIMAGFPAVAWIFETKHVNYRCKISECESNVVQYAPSWYNNAFPLSGNQILACKQYIRLSNNTTSCKFEDFNRSVIESCNKFVYETSEVSILQDFDLHCEQNIWKLTIVGTINSMGMFIGLPVAGMLSDRFGRKTIFIATTSLSAISGLIRSFSNTYLFFIIMEFVDSACRAATYPIGFILSAELAGPRKRVLIAILNSSCYALGLSIAGGLAWTFQKWRILLRVLYGVTLVVLTYYWLIPESIRWLLTKKRYKDAEKILRTIAKINEKKISEVNLNNLFSSTSMKTSSTHPLKELFKSPIITRRLINSCFCWIICIFCYYGLTINSVALSENSYLDFILTTLIELPSGFVAYLLVNKIGRRYCLSTGFFLCGIACLSFIFIPTDLRWLKLTIYLLGKFSSTINISVIYTVTTEIFPTSLRSSLLTICSMFGRIGLMVAPQMRLLEFYWAPISLTLFCGTSFIASVLCLLFPETNNMMLLDTIAEAEKIGKRNKEVQMLLS